MLNLAATILLALARRFKRGGVIINEHTLSRAQTRSHVEILRRWFDFIRLEDLPRALGRRTGRPFCLLTFDDGKRSNFSEAAPELERLQVPAVFYVPTGPLTTGKRLWFDRREQLIRALGGCPAGLELQTLKQLPYDLLLDRVERACAEYGSELSDESDDLRPMSWDEARDLHRRGFTIGAHSVTHAILTRETRTRAFAEIEESLDRVALELGAPCRTFAFPNGNYNAELLQHAARSGATTIMTAEPMWANPSVSLWQLPRVQLFGGSSSARIKAKIALAAFTGVLSSPDGSGRGYRVTRGKRRTLAPGMPVPGMSR